MRKFVMYGCFMSVLAALAGCGPASNASSAAPDTATPEPTHHWQTQDGQDYGYAAALSKDDQNAGRAASQVIMFRYLGVKDGVYSVASDNDGYQVVTSCTNPCQVIKLESPFGQVGHLTYSPSSVIGMVFDDVFNGQLKPYQAPGAQAVAAPTPEPAAPAPAAPPPTSEDSSKPETEALSK